MSEVLRLLLLIGLAGAGVTFLAALGAWFMAEDRRLARAFRNVLGQAPDAVLIAHGRGRAAAISLATGKVVVAWNSGGWCLVYTLFELAGAELSLDGEVVARVLRGEPRRVLDRKPGPDTEVKLRLLFDDPLHPDFELMLWPLPGQRRGAPTRSTEATAEANRWLGRLEAVLRRTGGAPPRPQAASPPQATAPVRPSRRPAPREDLFELDDDDEELTPEEVDEDGPPF